MAGQRIASGFPFPVYINEAGVAGRVAPSIYVDELGPLSASIAITESADTVAATLNSTFAVTVAITESGDVVAATLFANGSLAIAITETADAVSASITVGDVVAAASLHPYQPILTLGRMMGR